MLSNVDKDIFLNADEVKLLPVISAEWNQNLFNPPYITVAGDGSKHDFTNSSGKTVTAVTDSNKHINFDTYKFILDSDSASTKYSANLSSVQSAAYKVITYVKTEEGWLYVSVSFDLFSRKGVGLSMGASLETPLVVKTLDQAFTHRKPNKGLMHHSDRGCQYTSKHFKGFMEEYDVKLSMSHKGCCYDNAVAESFFHTLKTEHVDFCRYRTREEAVNSIFEYIEVFYNRQRLHSTLGYYSPVEYEKLWNIKQC